MPDKERDDKRDDAPKPVSTEKVAGTGGQMDTPSTKQFRGSAEGGVVAGMPAGPVSGDKPTALVEEAGLVQGEHETAADFDRRVARSKGEVSPSRHRTRGVVPR